MHVMRHRKKTTSSLYDAFSLGDRVSRKYRDSNGNRCRVEGVILAINDDSVKVLWDTISGKSDLKDIDICFSLCSKEEIFEGNEFFSPIKRKY